jgi:hypothetical protein
MTCIVRLALALALIVPLGAASLNAQTFGPSGPSKPAPTPGADKGAPAPTPGTVFRPTTTDVAPPAVPPPTTAGADWGNSQVDVAYTEPQDPQFRTIRERLMRRQVLEQLRLFLSPLRLPRKLLVQIDQCNAEQRPYVAGGPVTICYEYVAKVAQLVPRTPQLGGPAPDDMIVGAFVQQVLHEVAIATFDILDIPVWGRERDAADKLAGFIMVQFGKDVALRVMVGAARFFEASERQWTQTDFASDQAPEAQRFYNYLCIAIGADPTTFKYLVDQNTMPLRRAQRCQNEFLSLRQAFIQQIMPHVDPQLLKRVQSATWLILDEPK